jgi:hypothetical protein
MGLAGKTSRLLGKVGIVSRGTSFLSRAGAFGSKLVEKASAFGRQILKRPGVQSTLGKVARLPGSLLKHARGTGLWLKNMLSKQGLIALGDRVMSSPGVGKALQLGSRVLSSKPVASVVQRLSRWFGGRGSIADEVARSRVSPTLHSSGAQFTQLSPKRLAVFENHLEDLGKMFKPYKGKLNLSRKEFWQHILPHYHVYDAPVIPTAKANMRKAFEQTPGVLKTTKFPWQR